MQPVGNCQSSSPREAPKLRIRLDLMRSAILGVEFDTLKSWPVTTRKLRFFPFLCPSDSREQPFAFPRLPKYPWA